MSKYNFDKLLRLIKLLGFSVVLLMFLGEKLKWYILSNTVDTVTILILILCIFIDLYLDSKSKEYSTSSYITIANIVQVLAVLFMCYLSFQRVEVADETALWNRQRYIGYCQIAYLIAALISNLLHREKYKIEVK